MQNLTLTNSFFPIFIGLFLPFSNFCQTTYYENLINELSTDFGISGGEWVIGSNESFLEAGTYNNLDPQFNNPTDQPFELSVQLEVTNAGPNAWSQRASFSTLSPVNEGDILLLTCFVRNFSSDGKASQMAFSFQQLNSPWAVSQYQGENIPADGNWYRIFYPFDADLDHPLGETILQLQLGFETIDFEVGGLAVLNFQQLYTEDELPKQEVLYYEGIESSAPWRAEAIERIEEHRKADLEILVLDANDTPIENATVHFEMLNPAFRYGCVGEAIPLLQNEPMWDFYKEKFYDLFNYGTVGVFWGSSELDGYESDTLVAHLMLNNGMDIRITPVLWGIIAPTWSSMANDVHAALVDGDADYVSQRIEERLEDVADIFGHLVNDIELLNEPTHVTNLQDLLGEEEYLNWFQTMRDHLPDAKLMINDYEMLSFNAQTAPREAYKAVIENMLIADVPLDGVGFQAHMFDTPTPPETVYNVIEEFAQLGANYDRELDLKITEYDTDGMGDQLAAQYLGDFMTAVFSHPQISSFTMWGFWDGRHWLDDGPLFHLDMSPKPALAVYEDLVFNQWWTDETLTTNATGVSTLRGFKGQYLITVSFEGASIETFVELTENEEMTIKLDEITTMDNLNVLPDNLRLFPNLVYQGAPVFIEDLSNNKIEKIRIYNSKGQQIFAEQNSVGSFHIFTKNWNAGKYFVEINKAGSNKILSFEIIN